MEKAPRAGRSIPGWIIFVVAALCAVVVGGAVALHHADHSSTPAPVAVAEVAPPVPTTAAYAARPGPNGTKILSETVDQVTLAVPAGWAAPAADPMTLPAVINKVAAQAPHLAVLLQGLGQVEQRAGVRLFAYQPVAPYAYVSIISFATPTSKPYTPAGVAAVIALAKKKKSGIAVSGEQLAVGEVIKLDTTVVLQKQPVVVETLVLVLAGRTLQIQMAAETNVAGVPPVFAQIAQSLR